MSNFMEQITQQRLFRGDVPAREIALISDAIRTLDKTSERRQKYAWVAIAAGFLCLVTLLNALFSDQIATPEILQAALGIVLLVGGIVVLKMYGRTNFEDRRYQFLGAMTRLLQVDMAPDASLQIALNLLPQEHQSKYQKSDTVGRWSVKYYEDVWLELRGRFLDGTYFSLSMIEKHQVRNCRKRSRSGKTKYKCKTKNAATVIVALKTKAERYPSPEKLADMTSGAVQLPNWAMTKSLVVAGNQLSLQVTTKEPWAVHIAGGSSRPQCDGVQLVASMLLSLYQVLNLTREVAKSNGSE